MTRFIVLAFLAAAALVVMAAPAQEYEPLEVAAGEYNNQEEDDHLRFRRLTCDLLSFAGKVGDSACAANCISMGKAGGSCDGGVCKCRKDSVKQVWDNRFGKHG